jgi:hypothetical protein
MMMSSGARPHPRRQDPIELAADRILSSRKVAATALLVEDQRATTAPAKSRSCKNHEAKYRGTDSLTRPGGIELRRSLALGRFSGLASPEDPRTTDEVDEGTLATSGSLACKGEQRKKQSIHNAALQA